MQANHPIGFRLFSKVCSARPERRVAHSRPRAVQSVTSRACAPQAGNYASALYTLAESDGALATMAEVLFTQPPERGACDCTQALHMGAGPPLPAKAGGLTYVCIQPLCPRHLSPCPSSYWNFLCLPLLHAPPLTHRSYPPGASPSSATDGVAGPAPAPTLQAPPRPQPQTAERSLPPGAPTSSATDVVAGPAPALPAAMSTGSNPWLARPRNCVRACVCACVRACVRQCMRACVLVGARARVRAHAIHAQPRVSVALGGGGATGAGTGTARGHQRRHP